MGKARMRDKLDWWAIRKTEEYSANESNYGTSYNIGDGYGADFFGNIQSYYLQLLLIDIVSFRDESHRYRVAKSWFLK